MMQYSYIEIGFVLLRASGYLMSDKLVVPRRRVRKNWFEGLNPDPVDRSHPDVDDQLLVQEAAEMNLVPRELLLPGFIINACSFLFLTAKLLSHLLFSRINVLLTIIFF